MGVLSILIASAIAAGGADRCLALPRDASDLKKIECGESVDCWASRVLALETRLEYHAGCAQVLADEVAAQARTIEATQAASAASAASAKAFSDLAKPATDAWWQSPILWTSVGMLIGGAIVVGAAYAVRPAVR